VTGYTGPTGAAAAVSATVLTKVTTGTSTTVGALTQVLNQVIWSSATAGAKTTNIPAAASGNSGYRLGVATTLGNGDQHTVQAATGTIGNQTNITFTDASAAGSNVELLSDGTSNWIIL
jgi:hypothetical protein